MTNSAGGGRRFVKEHQIAFYRFFENVAGRAGDILMSALERKRRLFMIKQRRPPFIAVVARSAIAGPGPELIRMRVLVALGARNRRMREIDVRHRQLHIGRLVAFGASNGAMRTQQREIRFGVIELRSIFPYLGGMAEQASGWLAA